MNKETIAIRVFLFILSILILYKLNRQKYGQKK
jgi:hypothetical protein